MPLVNVLQLHCFAFFFFFFRGTSQKEDITCIERCPLFVCFFFVLQLLRASFTAEHNLNKYKKKKDEKEEIIIKKKARKRKKIAKTNWGARDAAAVHLP